MNYQKLSANMAALVEEFQSPSGPALTNAPRAVSSLSEKLWVHLLELAQELKPLG